MANKEFPYIPENLTADTPAVVENPYNTETLPLFAEYAVDFKNKTMILKNGRPYLVYENDALEVWIYKALHPETQLYAYNAYTQDYGNEIVKLIARFVNTDTKKSELQRLITEALMVNPYILSLSEFEFKQVGSIMHIEFTCETIYGKFRFKTESEEQ